MSSAIKSDRLSSTGRLLPSECANLSRSIKMSSMIVLILIVLALILLVAAIMCNYLYKTTDTNASSASEAKEKNKKQVVGILTITSAVFVFLATFSAIWQYSVSSKTAKSCLPL
ncbi:GrBNV gp95-like protein-like protein [Mauternbach virus]|uniref:GrBNV gp95-like protein-like protein n=1 Tax=Mauternbach virus TaxID=2486603 RepID=A0A3G3E680_9VIRU|nr:GrBNV gp95-like protein-like protein [Mauternbach virus]AYP97976.1 GrBNV gp95-like protein-like protein [Mauternbach virus]